MSDFLFVYWFCAIIERTQEQNAHILSAKSVGFLSLLKIIVSQAKFESISEFTGKIYLVIIYLGTVSQILL